jgi:prephenate dehydratase
MAPYTSPPAGAPRVAFQGELGAFSEEAVHRFFGDSVEPVPRREFADVGTAVIDGEVEFGLLPIENTLAGSVVGSYDVLAGGNLEIVGEVITPIHHCVLGTPDADIAGLKRVLSHPVALAQCTRFLRARRGVEAVAVYDTAGAAKEVAERNDPTIAAIAAARAATRYGLSILAENVEDRPDNQTRFLVVVPRGDARPDATALSRGPANKSSVLVETRNIPGALLQVLAPLAARGINLSKLESRPAGEPWSYRFFMELDADASDPQAAEALEEIQRGSNLMQILGSYPRWQSADPS